MARPQSPGFDEQREKLLAQAARLFASRGYPATSMNEVAAACGLSKATLYHYCADKYSLLVSIAESHVERLARRMEQVRTRRLAPEPLLRALIRELLAEYASAQDAQRVLTAEARFLKPADAERVHEKERAIVRGFTQALEQLRPDLASAHLAKPLTMLLFGMINWLFTWMKPHGGLLDHAAMAEIVSDLFLGGLPAVRMPHPQRLRA